MKKILELLTFFIVILTISSCQDDDDFAYTLYASDPPSEVNAAVNVSNDNSGVVTIAPSAVGASSFKVFFGDPNTDSPQIVGRNQTITKVYGEGDYTIKIIAVAPNDKTTEITKDISVSRTAVLNLEAGITISETNPLEVTVAPTATDANEFDVFFGEMNNETPVTLKEGETTTYTYNAGGTYTIRVVAKGDGTRTAEVSQNIALEGPVTAEPLSVTFDDSNIDYNFNAFGGAAYEVVTNPFLSGTNTQASMVAKFTNSGAAFEGMTYDLPTIIDFSGSNKTITMKFYSDVSVPVLLKFEGGVNGERQVEVIVQHGGTGWENLVFNYAVNGVKSYIDGNQGFGEPFVPEGQYAKIAMFIDGPGTTSGTFYMDDMVQSDPSNNGGNGNGLSLTFDDSNINYNFNAFGGTAFEVVTNPFLSGVNTQASMVAKFTNSGAAFEGMAYDLPEAIDFSGSNKTITMKFYSDVSVPVLLKFEGGVNGERQVEVIVQHGGTGWENLEFNYAVNGVKSYIDGNQGFGEPFVPEGQYAKIAMFIDGPGTTSGTFYMDDMIQQ
ncbi:hypothetical protein [Flavivirga eckloniae]|uniref:PKD domain-containing protein n=1 Tax=Flavivirga eckloniae TaxID=1803846 RepID=A0A2K9PRT9_9FLAO|nr:hypothetical protein [Flavivirga eckloniae]AUP79765.1 hypothetical protein C1H87_14055 [Flavivirga eckloniae]